MDGQRVRRGASSGVSEGQQVREDAGVGSWGGEIGYWLGWLVMLSMSERLFTVLAEAWWPGHLAATGVAGSLVSVGALGLLVVRRQQRHGRPVYSLPKAVGVAVVGLLGPVAIMVAFAGLLHLVQA